ncbi:MAG: SUMF1/EgtB/PvdO family nonheme iron enzyme, partial [Candidatus Delongbacteria bacterium]|nr:SUMF1/EgtB/PvdO family nonheme iron enzyme [Candidatus Delongbacteria bacterium]
MKKLITIILFVTISCFAGQLHINFNNASPSVDIEFNDLENIEILEVPTGMVFVKGGTYEMGDHFNEGRADELPVHSVTVSDIYISKFEVTQSEWAEYMPISTYDYGSGEDYPVYYVSWYEVIVYCNKRSIAEGISPCYSISSSTNPDDWGTIPTSNNSTWNAVTCNWS